MVEAISRVLYQEALPQYWPLINQSTVYKLHVYVCPVHAYLDIFENGDFFSLFAPPVYS